MLLLPPPPPTSRNPATLTHTHRNQAYLFLLYPLNAYLDLVSPSHLGIALAVVSITNYLTWVLSAIRQITQFLGIKCLTIKKLDS